MFIHYIFQLLFKKSRRWKVTKPLHPPAFYLYSHHYHFHNIWMFNHPHTTKYHPFCDFLMLGNKVFNRIVREKFLELSVKLRCQCLVVGYYKCRLLDSFDDIDHSKCLTGACYTHKGLMLPAVQNAAGKYIYCLWLISGRLIFRWYCELLRLIEVGASCFNHYCVDCGVTQLNVLHNVHRRISLG